MPGPFVESFPEPRNICHIIAWFEDTTGLFSTRSASSIILNVFKFVHEINTASQSFFPISNIALKLSFSDILATTVSSDSLNDFSSEILKLFL